MDLKEILEKDTFWNKIKKYVYILVILILLLILLIIILIIMMIKILSFHFAEK